MSQWQYRTAGIAIIVAKDDRAAGRYNVNGFSKAFQRRRSGVSLLPHVWYT
jgi:hypothetical protein